MGPPAAVLERQRWAGAAMNGGLSVRWRPTPLTLTGLWRATTRGLQNGTSVHRHYHNQRRVLSVWACRDFEGADVTRRGLAFAGSRFFLCCGGLLATTSTARSKRDHASGSS